MIEEKEDRMTLEGCYISFNLKWNSGKWEIIQYRSNAPNGIYVSIDLGDQKNNKDTIGFKSVGFSMSERFIVAQSSNIDYKQGAWPSVLPTDLAGGLSFAIRNPCKALDYRTDGSVRWINQDETKMMIHVHIIL